MKKVTTQGSYEATVTFLPSQDTYRVKVTYNYGDKVAFLRNYDTQKAADRAAKRELLKVSS